VYCRQDKISSERNPLRAESGSTLTVEIDDAPLNIAYSIKDLKYFEKYAKTYDDHHKEFTLFFGDTVRGAIWHEQLGVEVMPCAVNPCPGCDNCIPF
jgi:hypothetical protein